MRAAIIHPRATAPRLEAWADPVPGPHDLLVRLTHAAINRNDVLGLRHTADLAAPYVPGSDGCGVVVAAGADADRSLLGARVVIDPGLGWGDDPRAPDLAFEILGDPTNGTHAELVSVPAENVHPAPARLTGAEAAALPLAGVTAWRATVTRGQVQEGERVLVHGASGGVATFAIQIAAALGASVWVTTSSAEKLESAMSIGAAGGTVRSPGWIERLAAEGPVDLVIDSSGADWSSLLSLLVRGGRLVALGRTSSEAPDVDLHKLFWDHLDIRGTSMGSPADFVALLRHVETAAWRPLVHEILPLERVADAYRLLSEMRHTGKLVLAIGE